MSTEGILAMRAFAIWERARWVDTVSFYELIVMVD